MLFSRWLRRLYHRPPPRLNLALQGGGAHGAFTWGVLDRLLEERIDFEGISGASAGAMNAAVFATGWIRGGADGAREALHDFWLDLSRISKPFTPAPMDYLLSGWNRDWSPDYLLISGLTKVASPYQLNPSGFNPIEQLLPTHVDFEQLRATDQLKLFISATNVHTAQPRVFRNAELDTRVLLASSCLPVLFQAVEIDGEHYWDGGYSANPALYPVLLESASPDLLLVQLAPRKRDAVPTSIQEIAHRVNEISFSAHLFRELQLLAVLHRQSQHLPLSLHPLRRRVRALRFHLIHTEGTTEEMGRASHINADWQFLQHLRDRGRETAHAWLVRHRRALGRRSSERLQRFL